MAADPVHEGCPPPTILSYPRRMSADRVFRTETIDGLVVPAIIHNGGHYFVDMPVFADGLVDCWELVDLAGFREKLASGWVVPRAPDGATFRVHELAEWTVEEGRWELDEEGLYEKVVGRVRELNPTMERLHDGHGLTEEIVDGKAVAIMRVAHEKPVRLIHPERLWPDRVRGEERSVLVHDGHDGDYHVASLRVYADGVLELGRLSATETLDRAGFERAVRSRRVVANAPVGARVQIRGLGSFRVAGAFQLASMSEIVREIPDLVDAANHRLDSVARCRVAYAAYLAEPTVARREVLREAYESVPKHNRMYVGDMDTKDVAVRMVLYGDKEIETWSHRAVARALGHAPLPQIRVPKPVDEKGKGKGGRDTEKAAGLKGEVASGRRKGK